MWFTQSEDDLEPKRKALDSFRKQYPFKLKWPDRRPIGTSFPSGHFPDGRRWVFQPTTAPMKQADFEKAMTAHIDTCIKNCRAVNAQGLIVWSIEGEYQPHNTSYIGDPEKHEQFAPEMRIQAGKKPKVPGRIPRVARLMALAIRFEGLLWEGAVTDYAELTRLAHVSRARITQIMNLLLLAPDIQEAILFLPPVERGRDQLKLADLQKVALELSWERQRQLWQRMNRRQCRVSPQ